MYYFILNNKGIRFGRRNRLLFFWAPFWTSGVSIFGRFGRIRLSFWAFWTMGGTIFGRFGRIRLFFWAFWTMGVTIIGRFGRIRKKYKSCDEIKFLPLLGTFFRYMELSYKL
jgi:hypothetical protein